MKQILFSIFLLSISTQTIIACSCILETYCDLSENIPDNERALVFKGTPIAMDTLDEWTYGVQFSVSKVYQGQIITPDSPLYYGESYFNTDTTVWLLSGNSATCMRYFENQEAIIAVFYEQSWIPEIELHYVPTVCRGDYFPIAADGTVSGNIWSQYDFDVLSVQQFETLIESNCKTTNTTDVSIQDASIELYPQPACEYLNIKIQSGYNCKVGLHDLNGSKLQDVEGDQLDTSGLNPGVYFLSFEQEGKRQVKKFVKM